MILPDTDGAGAEFVARQISKSIADMKIEHSSSEHRYVSISIGISTVMPLSSSNMIEWMGNADKALYLAKNEGRNCIRTAVEKN